MSLAFKYLAPDEHGDIEIAGTGVGAYDVFGQRKFCERVEDLVESFPTCSLAAIYEAMAYALEHPDEMEAIDQANMAVQEQVLKEARERIRARLGK
ncbi:MAG TPA: DUF433 domain-containing protein [Chloroflexota bacterium]|nr:DUF433 domain-containing protein [Chloroflexota bacterium]